MSNNPFQNLEKKSKLNKLNVDVDTQIINIELIEQLLLITFSRELLSTGNVTLKPKLLYYLEDPRNDINTLSLDDINNIIFERIFTSLSKTNLVKSHGGYEVDVRVVLESNPLSYLYGCYFRTISKLNRANSAIEKTLNMFIECLLNQSSSYIINNYEIDPLKTGSDMYHYLIQHINESDCPNFTKQLFSATCKKLAEDGINNALAYFSSFFTYFLKKTFLNKPPQSQMLGLWKDPLQTLYCPERSEFVAVMGLLAAIPEAAEMIVDFSSPGPDSIGTDYERSLLGRFLCSSHLPVGMMQTPEVFTKMPMTTQEKNTEEQNIWQLTKSLQEDACHIFMSVFRCAKQRPQVKTKLLQWLGRCLHLNNGRSQLQHTLGGLSNVGLASDGFCMNLTAVLFHIAGPLLIGRLDKAGSIEVAFVEDRAANEALMPGLSDETRLIPMTENLTPVPLPDHYSVLTQLFFLVHKSFQLGFQAIHGRLMELYSQLNRMQTAYEELLSASTSGEESDRLKKMMAGQMSIYMSLQASMRLPDFMSKSLSLAVVSSRLLVATVAKGDWSVACVPEFVVDNVVAFLTFLRLFDDGFCEQAGDLDGLQSILEMAVQLMGSTARLRNPHLRAKVATVLEWLVPHRGDDQVPPGAPRTTFYLRQQLFSGRWSPSHDQVIEALVSAFTSMELSTGGENLRFEEKFQYRRPIYACFEFFHGNPKFDAQTKRLESEALERVDEVEAPLFLKFMNLLVNDANYLLDEALKYLGQLKTQEAERLAQGGRYSNQTDEGNFQHMGSLCKFHNTLATDTIGHLARLSRLCPGIMVHPVLVDRIACALNYFLVQLVGPRRGDLSVRDKDAYAFRPRALVTVIASIYVALGNEADFCRALVADGRSYSDGLLEAAADVLARVGEGIEVADAFCALKDRLKVCHANQAEEDVTLEDAPEEYLDPIMGTLMRDPVTLPSSGVTLDRKTIFRHLLSDPTDPFNRQPLAMTEVTANESLRKEITDWIAGQRSAST